MDDKLILDGRPFYFLGVNAYYLLESAAKGDSDIVKSVFSTSSALGVNVVRTWGFFDSSDSLDPAVVQYRPGIYNEHALRALDFVVYQARLHDIKLLIPLVNNWDDYGGMNQYVRWRVTYPSGHHPLQKYSVKEVGTIITGQAGRSYRYAITSTWGHDDFYADSLIRGWYKSYILEILERVNTITGVAYKEEQAIFGWELANEPRSSDPSTLLVGTWISEMSGFIKLLDPNHLVGTGEEGFDNTTVGYSTGNYNNQQWLFNGSPGVSFSSNTAISSIDFASIHLYPESWSLSNSSGNAWIHDHVRISSGRKKPLVIGEFGVRVDKAATYDSWMTTALLDGVGGALVWQLLEGSRRDAEGYGFHCSNDSSVCSILRSRAADFNLKSRTGGLPVPESFSLRQNYPNPFNVQTSITYSLPVASDVVLSVFNVAGEAVVTVVSGYQGAGVRKELFDARAYASGMYFYRLTAGGFSQTRKMLLLK